MQQLQQKLIDRLTKLDEAFDNFIIESEMTTDLS